jgi:hypothetical protein
MNIAQPSGVNHVDNTAGANANKVVNYNTTINNPKGETTEQSTTKTLRKLSYLGVP